MITNTNVAFAMPEAVSLAELSDGELLAKTRALVGRSNRLLAELLAHLGELEARGIHRTRACASLYTYLIYELRFSEDEAFRRVAAARLVRRFPALLDAVAAGELHLTGLLMLGPHLTEGNLVEVMARAKHRTKREIARLVRVLDPLPPVPARIEPLGPALARRGASAATWEKFVGSLNPVRELEPGERPREWGVLAADVEARADVAAPAAGVHAAGVHVPDADAPTGGVDAPDTNAPAAGAGAEVHAPPRAEGREFGELGPQLYKVEFTATEEYVRLVEEAKALLSHAAPRATLEDVQLRAMRALVETLRKRKYGTKDAEAEAAVKVPIAGHAGASADANEESRAGTSSEAPANQTRDSPAPPDPRRRRGRYIPVAVRRAAAARDHYRCTYVDACGTRCSETQRLEFHHVVPFALRPSHEVSNITLRCQAHNALAAEEDLGRELVQERKSAARHEGFAKQECRSPKRCAAVTSRSPARRSRASSAWPPSSSPSSTG